MDYVTFNGVANKVPYPNDFQMQKEPNIVNEITTMAGQTIADINGWKYADATLSWDYLPEDALQTILAQTDPVLKGEFTFGFYDMASSQSRKGVKALRVGIVTTKTRMHDADGNIIWTGVEMTLRFPYTY